MILALGYGDSVGLHHGFGVPFHGIPSLLSVLPQNRVSVEMGHGECRGHLVTEGHKTNSEAGGGPPDWRQMAPPECGVKLSGVSE